MSESFTYNGKTYQPNLDGTFSIVTGTPKKGVKEVKGNTAPLGRPSLVLTDKEQKKLLEKIKKGSPKKSIKNVILICEELQRQGIHFVTEYEFAESRKWRFDIFLPDAKLGVEYNGGVFDKGRHTNSIGYSKDLEKINAAQLLGYRVLQYSTIHFFKDNIGVEGIVDQIKQMFWQKKPL